MTWKVYQGDGEQRDAIFSEPPPWRQFPMSESGENQRQTFQSTPPLVDAINAAIHLRRPLLLTGSPGSGKSSVAEAIADELRLGSVLRWNVTSQATLAEAIYRYDALARLQHNQLNEIDDITRFLRLGPLGTALVASTASKPRVLLIDELDKGELDLPGDLLNVFERGEYEIPELNRLTETLVDIAGVDSDQHFTIERGQIRCVAFPIVVMTSNGEREFPAPFLRRCIRFRLNPPTVEHLTRIVAAHFDPETAASQRTLIEAFAERLQTRAAARPTLAVDQLLNAVFILSGPDAPEAEDQDQVRELILRELDQT